MSNSKVISEFAGAVGDIRAQLNDLSQRSSELEQRRHAIMNTRPHTDDIVQGFRRTLKDSARQFETQLAAYLNASFVKGDRAALNVAERSFNLLTMNLKVDEPGRMQPGDKRPEPQVNPLALVYLLGDVIDAALPSLVDRLAPDAAGGMKAAERAQALAAIDAEIAELAGQREALLADLEAARRALLPS